MISPPNRRSEVRRLERVLNHCAGPVVRDVSVLQRLDEWNAKEHGYHHDGVRDGQHEHIASDEPTKVPRERRPVVLPRVYRRAEEEQCKADPEKREETSEFIGLRLCVLPVQA